MPKFNQATFLKVAAMFVAIPRYVGLMLFLSGFAFDGRFLTALHISEGVAGLSLAVLEGFAIAYILSRRHLGFSRADKVAMLAVVAVLLILLPVCAAPYLVYLFDGSRLFVAGSLAGWNAVLKFCWAAAVASMPVFIIVGVALVEKDPVDAQILQAERQASLQQTLSRIEAETEQTTLHYKLLAQQARSEHRTNAQRIERDTQRTIDTPHTCDYCGASFASPQALAGHTGHCKVKANGNGHREAVR